MTELLYGITVPKIYTPGYGYSNASGTPEGGIGLGPGYADNIEASNAPVELLANASPWIYSTTFYGSNVKDLVPVIPIYKGASSFGSLSRSKKNKSRRKNRKEEKDYK